ALIFAISGAVAALIASATMSAIWSTLGSDMHLLHTIEHLPTEGQHVKLFRLLRGCWRGYRRGRRFVCGRIARGRSGLVSRIERSEAIVLLLQVWRVPA